ncbi:MAG: tetratricopeptide repeat protein, partial [Bacteroidales bacterium]|nr:tetratricopeptide repeat protein [Bacteroidales bacterium]
MSELLYKDECYSIIGKCFEVHNNLGADYYFIGDFNNSINHYLISLSIKEEKKTDGRTVGTPKSIASTMNNVGTIYDEMGNYDKALE